MKRFILNKVILLILVFLAISGCSEMQIAPNNGKPGVSFPFDWPQKEVTEASMEELGNSSENIIKLDIP
ncbi:MAG: hypothetical protein NC914_03400 [Candidatus Omnitrophica bacterium]|nr:hypothetical protein [Candidatus Omnitrophota bacterium]